MTLTGATLFSGIGAPECAMPHWDWCWHAEIEKFPCAVLAQRHPESINLGDVNAEDFVERAIGAGRPDVLVFGSPCQDFSVAGQRVGLDGDRGNLALVALGIAAKLRPRWLVFENVPGLLSSCSGSAEAERSLRDRGLRGDAVVGDHADAEEDSDFAAFLALVQQCGYLGCYRITDAQFAGVPQRRRRIFFVGYFGDWRPAAAVLLEPESLRGDSPPSRETREGIAPTISARPTGGGGLGTDFDLDGGLDESSVKQPFAFEEVVPTLRSGPTAGKSHGKLNGSDRMPLVGVPDGPDGAVSSKWSKGTGGPAGDECYNLVAAPPVTQRPYSDRGSDESLIAFTSKDYGGVAAIDQSPTLRAMEFDESHANGGAQVAIAFNLRGRDGGAMPETTDVASLRSASGGSSCSYVAQEAIGFDCKAGGETNFAVNQEAAGALRASHGGGHAAVFKPSHFTRGKDGGPSGGETPLGAEPDKGDQDPVLFTGTAVRRLTPRECERLQSYEDDYTLVKFRGKSAADGPRYKALGNSMNVNEIRWVLSRIEQFELRAVALSVKPQELPQ